MPAVHVDPITAPRLGLPGADESVRPVRRVVTGPRGFEGEGFPVVRAFAGVPAAELDPFIHMDQMGEVEYEPGEARGTDWHPHRGFETVTYMIDGRFRHQDSHGGGGLIGGGDVQWMTAGAGILHIETPPAELVDSGGVFHGIQLWVNLPAVDKMIAPRYQSLEGGRIAVMASADGGAVVRLIAGGMGGHVGPASTRTPIVMAHASIEPGARLHLPWPAGYNGLVYVLSGRGTVGDEDRALREGQLAVLGAGEWVTVAADEAQDAHRPTMEVLFLGGKPIREPVVQYGPFVMNSRSEIIEAFEDFKAGRLGSVPADAIRPHRSAT